MKLITWNVQWCRGVDGAVDPARIVAEARRLADFDVLCLQEIADNYPDPRLAGSDGEDQFARLAQLLPGFTAVPGIAVDQPGDDGRRRRFGNLILSRLPVRQVYRYLLPYPCDPGMPGMPRMAVEAVIDTASATLRAEGPPRGANSAPAGDSAAAQPQAWGDHVRVITTHLEYYSGKQRMAQVDALRAIYAEGHAHARDAQMTMTDGGPFQTFIRPRGTVITGDCNFEPDAPEHRRMLAPFVDGTPPLADAWSTLHPGKAHPPTFKIYEKKRPDEPELHCDFIFVGEELRARMRDIRVDVETQAADHQPVILTLA
jgi:endonuclease/exonuclease/phosphatase family metal-dependent hydrolase